MEEKHGPKYVLAVILQVIGFVMCIPGIFFWLVGNGSPNHIAELDPEMMPLFYKSLALAAAGAFIIWRARKLY